MTDVLTAAPHPSAYSAEPLTAAEIDKLEPTIRARVWATILSIKIEVDQMVQTYNDGYERGYDEGHDDGYADGVKNA